MFLVKNKADTQSKTATRKLTALSDLSASINIDNNTVANITGTDDKKEESPPEKKISLKMRVTRRRTRLSVDELISNSHAHIKSGPIRSNVPSVVVK